MMQKKCAGANRGVGKKKQAEQLNDADDVKGEQGRPEKNECVCVGGVREPEEERFTLNL